MSRQPPPGFVDLQVNGYKGISFSDPDLSKTDAEKACREVLKTGTVAFLPTLVTSPPEVYQRNLPLLEKVMEEPEFHGRLPGFHIEGPFISPQPGAVGAHHPPSVCSPSPEFLAQICDWAGAKVKLLTLAAETRGAEETAREATAKGICVSLGHQLALEDDVERLAAAGAKSLTHLGNGIPNSMDRHHNPFLAGLTCDSLAAMIITDSHHIPPSIIKTVLRVKGVEKTVVVSDASSIAGLPPGRYQGMGNLSVLEENGLLHNPEKNCLVGSSAMMFQCMNHLASLDLLTEEDLWRVGYHNPLDLVAVNPQEIPQEPKVDFDPASQRFILSSP